MTDQRIAEQRAALRRESAEYERRLAVAEDPEHPDADDIIKWRERAGQVEAEIARLSGGHRAAEKRPRRRGETRG